MGYFDNESPEARERRLSAKRAYYRANRETISAKNAERSKNKKEQIAKRMKAWREKNIERIRNRERAYTDKNRELIRNRRQKDAAGTAYRRARDRASQKGIKFDISLDEIRSIVERGVCELTGIQFIREFGTVKDRSFYYPSIDRIDSGRGYVPGNVRVVLAGVNMMMNTWGHEKIIEIADALRRSNVSKAA